MKYQAICFRQTEKSPIQLLFVSPTCDLDLWARVPTRMSSRPRGFQRAALGPHVRELEEFFDKDTTKTNSSPTTILVGLDPRFKEIVKITDRAGKLVDNVTTDPIPVEIEIAFKPWNTTSFDGDLAAEITSLFEDLEAANLIESPPEESDGELLQDDESDGVQDDQTDSDVTGGEYSIESQDAEEYETTEGDIAPDDQLLPAATPSSEIDNLPADLRLADLKALHAAWTSGKLVGDDKRLITLCEILKDERKPGLIIDGQHRVSATKNMGAIPFAVSLIPQAEWPELAFQFIVNNHTAKKVDENLLTAIVGQSLNDAELASIETRLNRAGIKVQLIRASTRVQVEDNPFMGMLRTSTVGERGFLESKAMQKHVIGLWFGKRARVTDRPGMAGFVLSTDERLSMRRHSMSTLFLANCEGTTKLDRIRDWQRDKWLAYFSAFWDAVRQQYKPSRVWPQSAEDWPRPGLSNHTPNQQLVLKLMRTTLLGLFQVSILQRWADRRFELHDLDEKAVAKLQTTPEQFHDEIKSIITPLSADFFVSLNASGFDGSVSVKEDMKLMIYDILRKAKSIADQKARAEYKKYFQ